MSVNAGPEALLHPQSKRSTSNPKGPSEGHAVSRILPKARILPGKLAAPDRVKELDLPNELSARHREHAHARVSPLSWRKLRLRLRRTIRCLRIASHQRRARKIVRPHSPCRALVRIRR